MPCITDLKPGRRRSLPPSLRSVGECPPLQNRPSGRLQAKKERKAREKPPRKLRWGPFSFRSRFSLPLSAISTKCRFCASVCPPKIRYAKPRPFCIIGSACSAAQRQAYTLAVCNFENKGRIAFNIFYIIPYINLICKAIVGQTPCKIVESSMMGDTILEKI